MAFAPAGAHHRKIDGVPWAHSHRRLRKAARMPAPKFSTSGPRRPSKSRRRFTLAEANRSLPLVSRIVRDIVNLNDRVGQLQAKLDAVSAASADAVAIQQQLDAAHVRLQEYAEELKGLGVELKDLEMGLVDFPGRHQGRDVYLCWKLGEESVAHWHELESGFSGRQPAKTLREAE
jgi:hypothetical protein